MREIKYQLVWQGAIYEPLDMRQIASGQWEIKGKMYQDNDKNGQYKGDYVSIPRKDYDFFSEYENDFGIWRQYTGFNDILGKEIYDQDICDFSGTIGIYKWDNQDGSYKIYNTEGKWMPLITLCAPCIIGNIYETPELINK